MSQDERARDLVNELYEFSGNTLLSADDVMRSAKEAAAQAKSRASLGGGIRWVGDDTPTEGSLASNFEITGTGNIMTFMTFQVFATPRPDGKGSFVALKVDDFVFEKGSFGMKPTINAGSVIAKYVRILRQALA